MPEVKITKEEQGARADAVLAQRLHIPRTKIQKLIKQKEVLCNGTAAKASQRLAAGDTISYPTLIVRARKPKRASAPILEVIYEDQQLLVINKPAGLIVHEIEGREHEPTVVDALLERRPDIVEVGEDPLRPGIVHRLDKDASGVMLIAKTQEMFSYLKKQFHDRKVKKEYLALVYGALKNASGTITLKIARSKNRGRMVARPQSQEGRDAHTRWEIVSKFKTATLCRIWIATGRTHQIRAHFKAINHPIVGDILYRKRHMKHIHPIELNRLFLHANKLTLTLPNGKQRTFEAAFPNELQMLLKNLPRV